MMNPCMRHLTGILPVIAPGISVPTFVNNVLAEHMEKYRDIIDETCHRKLKNDGMEGLVYLSVRVGCAAYLLYKVCEQKKST